MSPYRVVNSKSCHLPIKIKHRAYWAKQMLTYDLTKLGKDSRLQLRELEEIRVHVYENARSYKERAMLFMMHTFLEVCYGYKSVLI